MTEAARFIQDLAVIMIAAALAGLLCKKVRLSPIVGYLIAGVVVGPFTPLAKLLDVPYGFVADVSRVNLFAELGMVFLMFGIGLEFSLKRLRQLGLGVVFAAVVEGFLIFNLARLAAIALGLDTAATVFFASTLVISSSAVIGKTLTDTGRTHEKSSQLAVGIMLSEDIVVIILLTLLGSYVHFGPESGHGGGDSRSVLQTLALFGGFVVLLATLGLLLIPRVLKRLSREATSELETIFVAGLLFGLSLIVVKAGYSLALGAFLLGAIIAETPQRAHVERAFSGMHALFGMMFFVAIGMTIDVSTMPAAIGPLLVLTTLALVGRALAAGGAMVLLGHDAQMAIRTALILTPIGEFSFVIARMGTDPQNGILPPEYMAAVVGASLLTSLISPVLIRHNQAIAERFSRRRIPLLSRAVEQYHRALETLQRQRDSSLLLKLTRKRLIQIAVEVTLVSAFLFFAQPLIDWVVSLVGPQILPDVSTALVCWGALGLLLLAPLIAIWRNVQALSMILADYLTHGKSGLQRARPLFTNVFQIVASLALVLWLWNFIPVGGGLWLTIGVLAFLVVTALALWRRLIHWHSTMEVTLEASLTDEQPKPGQALIDRYAPWGLHVGEIALPDRFAFAGQTIGELGLRARFGCSVIGIERQGFNIHNPGPSSHLFSEDRVLVLGTDDQIAAVRQHLLDEHPAETPVDTFRDISVESVAIAAGSRAAGQTLAQLNWPRLLGIQVVGHERGDTRTITPSGSLRVDAGDRILVLGTPTQMATLRDWVG